MADSDDEDFLVTLDDVRGHHCVAGLRRWLHAQGIDLREALTTGVPASRLTATGDALAHEMVATARANRGR